MAVKLVQDGKFEYLYIKGAIAYYASVHKPRLKYQSKDEREYQITLFVSPKDAETLEDEFRLNKTLYRVDKDKNKKKVLKYSSKDYPEAKGMVGITISLNEFRKSGERNTLIVVGEDGKPLDKKTLIGNGSKVSVKCFGYRNEDDLLVVSLAIVKVEELVAYEGGASGHIKDDELGLDFELEDEPKSDTTFDDLDEPPFEPDTSDDDDY